MHAVADLRVGLPASERIPSAMRERLQNYPYAGVAR